MPNASAHPGMGAIVHDAGVAFRVWAPNAEAVFVTGSFNDWSEDAAAMAPEDGGIWYRRRSGREARRRVPLPDPQRRRGALADRPLRPRGHDLRRQRHRRRSDARLARRRLRDAPPWNEAGHLRDARRHVPPSRRGDGRAPSPMRSSKLGHLKRLGVNAVQIMPAMEFAGDISWGYNPAHIFAVESAYGGPEGFKAFVEAAHRSGIAVILDVVYNHFGPSDLDLWQFDGWSENDKGGIYFYNDWRSDTPWGDTRPDYGRSEVRQFIRDNALYWLDEYHLDGLRFDMTALHPQRARRRGRRRRRARRGLEPAAVDQCRDRRALSRDASPSPRTCATGAEITAAVEDGGAGFGAQWDSQFVHPIREVLIAPRDEARHMATVAPRAHPSLQRRRVPPGDLHRVPRRGGERQGAHPARDRPGRSRRTWPRRSARRSAPR